MQELRGGSSEAYHLYSHDVLTKCGDKNRSGQGRLRSFSNAVANGLLIEHLHNQPLTQPYTASSLQAPTGDSLHMYVSMLEYQEVQLEVESAFRYNSGYYYYYYSAMGVDFWHLIVQ